jgi:hypothetical protein
MHRQLLVFLLLVALGAAGMLTAAACTPKKALAAAEPPAEASPTTEPEQPEGLPAFMVAIQEKVKGKEDLPAEEVFEDIDILKGIPAGRVLPLMRTAFSQSLGVRCNHCHVFNEWADNSNPTKDVAREMWRMTGRINRELLAGIDNLGSLEPTVNCTTCHRGEVKPALRMEERE